MRTLGESTAVTAGWVVPLVLLVLALVVRVYVMRSERGGRGPRRGP